MYTDSCSMDITVGLSYLKWLDDNFPVKNENSKKENEFMDKFGGKMKKNIFYRKLKQMYEDMDKARDEARKVFHASLEQINEQYPTGCFGGIGERINRVYIEGKK